MCVMLSLPAFAGNSGFVFDLTQASIAEDKIEILNEKAKKLEEDYGFSFYYVIAPKLDGFDSLQAYAADIFAKKSSEGDEGAVFLYVISEDESVYYSTEGAKRMVSFDRTQMFYDCFDKATSYYEAGSSCYAYMLSLLMAQQSAQSAVGAQAVAAAQSTGDTATAESKEIPSNRQLPLVVDYADVLTPEQETALNKKLEAYSAECESDIAFATVESTHGVNLTAFADDFYDYNGYGYGENDDGMLMVMSMDDRQWWITTYGKCEKAFTVDDLKAEVSEVSESLKTDDFNTAFNSLADSFKAEIEKVGKVSPLMIPVALAIGFAIAYFVMKIRTANLKSVVAQVSADNYVVPDSLVMKYSNDCFLYSNIAKTAKQTSSSSSGSHTSSSGRSHGGAGGSF